MNSLGKVIKSFKQNLKDIYPENEIKAIIEMVFEKILNLTKTGIIVNDEQEISDKQAYELKNVLNRLIKNEPIQYILEESYFYNIQLKIEEGVLIPRQETEELVDWIINEHKDFEKLKILDVGTGSGCIAISLATNLKKSSVTAFDVSETALKIAKSNSDLNKVNIEFRKIDILHNIENESIELFDIVVSNPPYVLKNEKHLMKKNVLDFEPELALFVENEDPLQFYKAILNYSSYHLKNSGKLYFEINEAFGKQMEELMTNSGYTQVELKKDINGKYRMIAGVKKL